MGFWRGHYFTGNRKVAGSAVIFESIHKVLNKKFELELSGGFRDLGSVMAQVVTR
jgi:hypothetical protein